MRTDISVFQFPNNFLLEGEGTSVVQEFFEDNKFKISVVRGAFKNDKIEKGVSISYDSEGEFLKTEGEFLDSECQVELRNVLLFDEVKSMEEPLYNIFKRN